MKRRPGCPRVEPPARGNIDARTIRLNSRGVGTTQAAFAQAIGISVKTLRNWEQRRREPTGPARVLLTLLERDPWLVFDVANGQHLITPAAQLIQRKNSYASLSYGLGLNMPTRKPKPPADSLDSLKRSGPIQTATNAEKRMGGAPIESARSRNWRFA